MIANIYHAQPLFSIAHLNGGGMLSAFCYIGTDEENERIKAALDFKGRDDRLSAKKGYELVATVKLTETKISAGLEEAFRLTNHVTKNWFEGDQIVSTYAERMLRSTSVGDVITIGNEDVTNYDFRSFAVAPYCFAEIK